MGGGARIWLHLSAEAGGTWIFVGQLPPNMQMSLVSCPRTTGVRQRVNNALFNQPLIQRQGSSGSQQTSSEPCWQLLAKNGNCPFGDRCRFSHTNLPPHRNDEKKNQPASAPTVSTSLRHEAWSEMLPSNFPGRENLLFDIRNGFDVMNSPVDSSNYVETNNYRSATNCQARPYVERQILDELAHDRYGIAATRPHIVSALGALAKNPKKTKFRLIHDASRPQGQSLNDLPINEPFNYQTIQGGVNWAICAGNSPVPVNSPHKGQWRRALIFTLISARINGWLNNR